MKRRHAKRKGSDPAYLALVAQLPCAVANGRCSGRITCHHKSGAGMGLRAPDREAMPLCIAHHLHGPKSIEELGSKAWERLHGVSQAELVERTQAQIVDRAVSP